ncbi:EscR/YscR/HrcR family type III secretion system export apparatus protein [uncultured Tateyamaria sp.]|uniref:EscR/YscR/HrcR family type III secretion system export apparatus protein n=1 Tax=uncultured Tateyamaria sp. TaxID=455651 RepID=UPI0026246B79|nr:EscR/YscR/HrcR family type III secretion system export apparatus protein [uncultured Tateyamaria sp.]
MESLTTPIIISFLAGFMVLAVLTLTSFIKLSVVFMIIRQALGLQQVPSNMVLMALAGFTAVFISMPVFSASLSALSQADENLSTPTGLIRLWQIGIAPFQKFILGNVNEQHLEFFITVSKDLWAGSGITGSREDFIIQVPAFMVSELTEAFRMGFLIYLPFVAIDLAVTAILMALGMQMVQPNIIATPFKLLTFVFVDGWARLVEGLILSYGGA